VDDDGKTKEELLRELRELRRQHSDMDITNADRKQSLACPPPGEAFFRSFIENGLDIITVLDANGSFIYQSPSVERMLGYLPEELIGKSAFEYIHPEDRSRVIDAFNDIVGNPGASTSLEYRFSLKDSSWRHFDSVGKMLPADVAASGVVIISRDITDRKLAEEVLLKSESRFRRAEEVSNFGNWELFVDEQVIHASDGARIIYGFEGKEWQLSDVQQIVLPEYRTMLDKALTELIEQGRQYDVEFKIRRLSDDRIIDIHSLAKYEPIQRIVFGVIKNTTELHRAEEELKLKSFTIDNLAEEVFWTTSDGRIWNVNDVACEKLGYTHEELLSLSVADFDPLVPKEAWQSHWEELKRLGSMQFESLHKTKDGNVFPVEIIAKYFNYNGLEYDCSIVRDITQHKNLENALQASEEQFRTLCDFVPIGIVRTDSEGHNIYSNPYLENITGTSAAALLGEGWIKLIHPENLEEVTKVIIEATTTGSLFSIEHRVLTPQHKMLWVRALGAPLKSPDCAFLGHVGIVEDITDRKQAEHELRLLKFCMDKAPIGILMLSPEGKVLAVNDYTARSLGYTPEELIGLTVFDFDPKCSPAMWNEQVQNVREKRAITFETTHKNKDGISFPMEITGSYMEFLGNEYLISFENDITERKRAEEALRLAEKTFRDLLETIHLVAFILDSEGNITFCNDYLLHLTGWKKEDLLGRNWVDLFIPYSERENIRTIFSSILKGEKDYLHCENSIVTREGKEHLISWNNTVLHDLEGKITGTASIGIDITEHRSLEAQLRQAQKMEAVGQLAGGIAHDFNNILSAIVGYAYLLQSRLGSNDPSRDDVEQILESAHKAAEVTHSLLAFSRKQSLIPKPFLLIDIVKRFEKLVSRVIGEDITINTMFLCDEVKCIVDAGQIEQVLMNLATNARDAMPYGGRLTLSTECVELDESFIRAYGYGKLGRYALISFSDTGVGMSIETTAKIFEPFFTTKEIGKGTGLGLAMVYGIIKQHDGYINVYSELGKGTTFNIYLPAAESKEEEPVKAIESLPPGGTETILVTEDNEKIRKLFEVILKTQGYKVILAQDGEEAIEKFIENKDKIHLVLLDMIMPKKSGKEVYDEIKRLELRNVVWVKKQHETGQEWLWATRN
jgi:PAS domain S-box-containing protein